MPRNLVTLVASRLMEATAWTAAEVTQEVVATLAEVFDADAAFLRNNYGIGASKLIAERPRTAGFQGGDQRLARLGQIRRQRWRPNR